MSRCREPSARNTPVSSCSAARPSRRTLRSSRASELPSCESRSTKRASSADARLDAVDVERAIAVALQAIDGQFRAVAEFDVEHRIHEVLARAVVGVARAAAGRGCRRPCARRCAGLASVGLAPVACSDTCSTSSRSRRLHLEQERLGAERGIQRGEALGAAAREQRSTAASSLVGARPDVERRSVEARELRRRGVVARRAVQRSRARFGEQRRPARS